MKIAAKDARARPFVIAWLALSLLAGLSVASAFAGLGLAEPIAEFVIAAVQAAIVFLLFMRLKGPPSLKWLFAGAGLFWLMLLYGISMTDYATRQGWPAH